MLESTTYPGTTREELLTRFEKTGLDCGRDYFLAFSPEREDPGNEHFNTRTIPKIVGGIDAPSLRRGAGALRRRSSIASCPSPRAEVAESAKLLENIFRAVNIALVNEMKVVFDRMGIDVWEVIEAAKTKPFGFMPFYPGPGLGGHCIPLDPFYLTWKAAEYGTWARFIELAGEINTSMPRYVVDRTVEAVNEHGKSIVGATGAACSASRTSRHRRRPRVAVVRADRAAAGARRDRRRTAIRSSRRRAAAASTTSICSSVPCTRRGVREVRRGARSRPRIRSSTIRRSTRRRKLVIDTRNIVPRDAGINVVRA